jgi:hypothetical protein
MKPWYRFFQRFGNGAKPKAKRFPGRSRRMQSPTITTISLEKTLLIAMKERASNRRQSVSQWITDAALQRMERELAFVAVSNAVEKEVMAE